MVFGTTAGGKTHPVALKVPNHWGLFDMHGNMWEWVHDWYSSTYYSVSPTNDPQGPVTGTMRVLRGGSWSALALGSRSAQRNVYTPDTRAYVGFRLARTH
jgi:formylglycine-generating enzyme